MKLLKLKAWLENLIIFIQVIIIILLSSEYVDTLTFLISKIILISLFIINHVVLMKYEKIGD